MEARPTAQRTIIGNFIFEAQSTSALAIPVYFDVTYLSELACQILVGVSTFAKFGGSTSCLFADRFDEHSVLSTLAAGSSQTPFTVKLFA